MLLDPMLHPTEDQTAPASEWPKEPYKGLNFFSKQDAPLFGQRDPDTRNCLAIIGAVTNKILLLHGRSGTGKSSFLRAGLLPHLVQAKFWCLETPESGEQPFLIRCTENPLLKTHEALLMHLHGATELEFLDQRNRLAAVKLLQAKVANPLELPDLLLEAMSILSQGLTRTVVLTVDQSEELFSLCAGNDVRGAFFYFLEEICMRHLDIKLVVTLRTEYYGQFCDQLRIDPNLKVSTSHTSLDQYMLHGLRSVDQIAAAILRPTSKVTLNNYGIPFEKYGFEFDPGVAEHIAQNLLEHCGESSTLPVMQIVCRDLHHAVVLEGEQSHISLLDYTRLGGVEGRVNAFIESSIQSAVNNVNGSAPARRDIEKWQEVLAELVARHEGGVLTTLLIDEETLIERAKGIGITDDTRRCLEEMADEKCGLLRRASRTDPATQTVHRQFSLGHDSLAPALFQWREARADLQRERNKLRHLQWAFAIALLSIAAIVGLFSWQRFLTHAQNVKMYSAIVDEDTTPNFRAKILLSLASLSESNSVLRKYLGHDTGVQRLKTLLARAPTLVGGPALAVGIVGSTFQIAHLDRDGSIHIQNINSAAHQDSLVGQIPQTGASTPRPVVGFVSGLRALVAVADHKIFWWPNDSYSQSSSPPTETPLKDLLKLEGNFWVDIAGGEIRAQQASGDPRTYKFSNIMFTDGHFVATSLSQLELQGAIWPTFSPHSGRFLYIKDHQLLSATRLEPSATTIIEKLTNSPNEPFLASLGFAMDDEAVVVRSSRANIQIYAGRQQDIKIDEAFQSEPIRPRFGASRPLIASVKKGSGWRVAWVEPDGIVVVDSPPGQETDFGTVVTPKPLLPAVALDSITRLEFSADGRFLIAVAQNGFQEPLFYRVWDLSNDHKSYIDRLEERELWKSACASAKLEGSDQFTLVESQSLSVSQPCGR